MPATTDCGRKIICNTIPDTDGAAAANRAHDLGELNELRFEAREIFHLFRPHVLIERPADDLIRQFRRWLRFLSLAVVHHSLLPPTSWPGLGISAHSVSN